MWNILYLRVFFKSVHVHVYLLCAFIIVYVYKLNKHLFFRMVSNQTKTNGLVPVHQQILALVSAPFGDSPLLKNLLPVSIVSHSE